MPASEDPSIPYHTQLEGYYCGPACAEMILDQLLVSLPYPTEHLIQDELYQENRNHTSYGAQYYTAPDGLTWALNHNLPSTFTGKFALCALDYEDTISRKLVWTIHHYSVAAAALVYGFRHWLVVRGYDASAAPTSSGDTTYSISAFYANDPAGSADEHITYTAWQSTYMLPVPHYYHWEGKYVAVCDADPPADRVGKAQPRRRVRDDEESLLPPAAAAEQAVAGLQAYGLYQKESWRNALAGTKAGKPVLVQRLDCLDSFYYIVPLQAAPKPVAALACVDARTGHYLQAALIPERGAGPLAGLSYDPNAILEKLIGQRIELGDRQGRLVVHREANSLYPTLVWKPCRESLSPYIPFFMVTVGDHRLYIRVDGRLFTQLHDQEGGL